MMLRWRLAALALDVPWHVAGLIVLGLLAIATYVGQGFLVAESILRIFAGAAWGDIAPLLLWAGALMLVRAGLLWLREVGARWTAAAVKLRLRKRLYARLLELGPGYLERTQTGAVQATLVDGVEALEGYLAYYLPQAVIVLIGPLLLLAVLLALDPVVGLVVVVAALLAPLGPVVTDRLLRKVGKRSWDAYVAVNTGFVDAMQGMATAKAFNASARRGEVLQRQATALYRAATAQNAVSLLSSGVVGLAMGTGIAAAIGIGAVRVAGGAMTLGEVLVVLFLVRECFRPFAQLNTYWHQGYQGISTSEGIFALLDARPEVAEPERPLAIDPHALEPSFAFEHVTFGYDRGARPALRQLSFSARPGETVALVGRSGAGKTTVVSLLLRFFDPQEGRILLGGHDLRAYSLDRLRAMVAVVWQETYLFHGSVADNLRRAKPDATQAELEAAARAANAHDFIIALPRGYETIVGERGLKLSGGERQRVAIARALLKDAPILILDEATSSVDAANEAAIQEALERLTAQRTTLVIAHRLSTVVRADRIIVLQDGRAVEMGRHLELLRRGGAYAGLVAAQSGAG